jgi:zinc-ribbon domain/WD40-like Beta Propeller Repeat
MLCRQCGKELEEGRRFCIFCGAEQVPAGPGGAQQGPAPGKTPGMSTMAKVIIGVVAVLVVAGAAVGTYFGVRSSSSNKPGSSQTTTITTPNTGVTSAKSEKLAYINGKDIDTIDLNGAAQQKITSRGDIVDFAVAPDGSRIAFVAAPGDQRIIYKMNPDGSDLSQVTLPEKGLAENPAFDPTNKYIYFTRVTPEDQANIEAGQPFGVGFERYDIAANKVDHLYTHGGLQEQSIEGLYADPSGGALYFNLFGSDWPSSVPHKLSLGPPVTESVYMPMQRDTGKYTAVAFQVTGFSRKGTYVSYFKSALLAEQSQQTGPTQEADACFKRAVSGEETVVATYVPSQTQQGDVSGMEFSNVANDTCYYAKVQSADPNANSLTLEFYKGKTDGSRAVTGLNVTLAMETEQYTPLVWHLLAVEK